MTTTPRRESRRAQHARGATGARVTVRNTLLAYAFMLPFLVLLALYHTWPVLFGTYLAFTRYNIIRPPEWVGLENFRTLAADPQFWSGLKNSLKYILVVPVIQILAIAVAMLVNRPLKGIGFFRTAYYVPVVTSFAVVGLIWTWMYQQDGPVNAVLGALGLHRGGSLLNNPFTALYAVMFVTLWKGIGYYMVLYLAGLQAIGKELEEAAELDGATRWQVFLNVTLPGLRPTILVCSLLSTISALKVFEEIYVMTQGGPAGSTYTALFFTYSRAFVDFQYGLAAAAGLIIAVVSILFGWLNFKLTRGGRADA
ncbi:carbohydrate ABC transporter permease [Deinococcus geothermalis]|uniref:Carbohydrate ABC transporter membrane protein 1, CUT1 family n=1 Tax=Deinococcus geothermalis (strain DSM 11300 / CIP 105573 / AG-3a) TaxID=319795 RepID=Q1IZ69_DEIGD|nr:sugar ABC transporter permease [Deinococcus geothermalis]ABF45465.1 carbohydrate ABC transporter membrane protein 1, CUT1 family [Deinococcus geothermalis DSM 11300]